MSLLHSEVHLLALGKALFPLQIQPLGPGVRNVSNFMGQQKLGHSAEQSLQPQQRAKSELGATGGLGQPCPMPCYPAQLKEMK